MGDKPRKTLPLRGRGPRRMISERGSARGGVDRFFGATVFFWCNAVLLSISRRCVMPFVAANGRETKTPRVVSFGIASQR